MHWLDLIRVRPGMYLGAAPPHFGAMLDRLDTWIVGYGEAVRAHAVEDRASTSMRRSGGTSN